MNQAVQMKSTDKVAEVKRVKNEIAYAKDQRRRIKINFSHMPQETRRTATNTLSFLDQKIEKLEEDLACLRLFK